MSEPETSYFVQMLADNRWLYRWFYELLSNPVYLEVKHEEKPHNVYMTNVYLKRKGYRNKIPLIGRMYNKDTDGEFLEAIDLCESLTSLPFKFNVMIIVFIFLLERCYEFDKLGKPNLLKQLDDINSGDNRSKGYLYYTPISSLKPLSDFFDEYLRESILGLREEGMSCKLLRDKSFKEFVKRNYFGSLEQQYKKTQVDVIKHVISILRYLQKARQLELFDPSEEPAKIISGKPRYSRKITPAVIKALIDYKRDHSSESPTSMMVKVADGFNFETIREWIKLNAKYYPKIENKTPTKVITLLADGDEKSWFLELKRYDKRFGNQLQHYLYPSER